MKEISNSVISTNSSSSIWHAAYTRGLSVFLNLHVRIYVGFLLVGESHTVKEKNRYYAHGSDTDIVMCHDLTNAS